MSSKTNKYKDYGTFYTVEGFEVLQRRIAGEKLIDDHQNLQSIKRFFVYFFIFFIVTAFSVTLFCFFYLPEFRDNIANIIGANIVNAFIGVLYILSIKKEEK